MLPDKLGEVSVGGKVATRLLLAIVLEVLHFAVVPLSGDTAGGSLALAAEVVAAAVRSKVLTGTIKS